MTSIRPILFAAVLLSAVPSRGVPADRLDEVLAAMKQAGERLETLSSDFVQTDHDFILEDDETSKGKLYYQVPGKIRWEYAPPREKVLLVKDDLVRLYNPTAHHVHEFERGKGGKSGGADLLVGFGKSNDKIAETYDATLAEETEGTVVLSLLPKPDSAASIFTKIELTVDKKSWTPLRSVFHEPNHDTTDIQFQNMKVNGPLPPKVFELELPPNVEIVKNR